MRNHVYLAAQSLRALAGLSNTSNAIEAGYWREIALAAESLAGTTSTATDTVPGYMLRAAVALEGLEGTSGAEENSNYFGLLKRIVDALETVSGVTEGSLEQRLETAAAVYSVFSPADLFAASEQGVWYDPSDLSTMFQDTAGTVPVTATGQSVARINDKSGRGNHATQATGASQPTLQNDGVNNYLLFDGADDFMVTASIDMSATDQVTACAGVRKLVDAQACLAELSVTSTANAGTFFLAASGGGVANYFFRSIGTLTSDRSTASSYAAPITNVFTGLGQISTDTNAVRINGAEVANIATNQGTGNMGNYPLYIGRRGGTTFPFNGRIYQLVVRNALATGGDLTNLEAFVNGKTGAY